MSLVTVSDALLNPDDSPRVGQITFVPTRAAASGSGLIPASSAVSLTLDEDGEFSVQLTPNEEFDATTYYQLWFKANGTQAREFIGLYDFPVSTEPQDLLSNRITNADGVYYKFASESVVNALVSNALAAGSVAADAVLNLDLTPNSSGAAAANKTKFEAWYNALPDNGGVIRFPAGKFFFNELIDIAKPVQIIGAGSQPVADTGESAGTVLCFPNNKNGLRFTRGPLSDLNTSNQGAINSSVRDLTVQTASGYAGSTVGDGIYASTRVLLERVYVRGFARHGVFLDTTTPYGDYGKNANQSRLIGVEVWGVKKDGFRLEGTDSNAVTIENCRVTLAGRHGFYLAAGGSNFIVNNITEFSAREEAGYDYVVASSSNFIVLPYGESGVGYDASMHFESGVAYNKIFISTFGAVELTFNSASEALANQIEKNGFINQLLLDAVSMEAEGGSRTKYSLRSTNINEGGELRLYDETHGWLAWAVSPANGGFHTKRRVKDKTANHTPYSDEARAFFTNAGASGTVVFTLDNLPIGYDATFFIAAAQTLQVTADAGETIRSGANVTAAAGNISANTIGNLVRLVKISSTQWVAESITGTWTFSS